MTLSELKNDSDWAQVFADENAGNVEKFIHTTPGSTVSDAPFSRSDVSEIIASIDGENDGTDWLGVFRLKDGRFAVCSGGCDYTGWDCIGFNHMAVFSNMEEVVTLGLTDNQRLILQL